jgi:hypothetical protein
MVCLLLEKFPVPVMIKMPARLDKPYRLLDLRVIGLHMGDQGNLCDRPVKGIAGFGDVRGNPVDTSGFFMVAVLTEIIVNAEDQQQAARYPDGQQ